MKQSVGTRCSCRAAVLVVLLGLAAIGAGGCAMRISAAGASTYQKSSVYRSAAATIGLNPEDAFDAAATLLLEHGGIEITKLEERENRCSAVAGEHKLTLRVTEVGPGRTRVSILVGGGRDAEANQRLADEIVEEICARLGTTCE